MKSLIEDTRAEIEELMREHPTSVHIKNLQSLRLQYAVTAVGIFSIFEADLQRELGAADGFRAVRDLLQKEGAIELRDRFNLFATAINVLKHGSGRSYDSLVDEKVDLPFRIRKPEDDFFDEGDCTEIDTLVLVDDAFVQDCAKLVYEISEIVFQSKYPSQAASRAR